MPSADLLIDAKEVPMQVCFSVMESLKLDDDRALKRRVRTLVVIVIAAGSGAVEVARLTALAG